MSHRFVDQTPQRIEDKNKFGNWVVNLAKKPAVNCGNHGLGKPFCIWSFTTRQQRLSLVAIDKPVLTLYDSGQLKIVWLFTLTKTEV